MKRELENMKLHYELLEKKMTQAEEVLDGIQKRDNNIYRTYFEANPFRRSKGRLVLEVLTDTSLLKDLTILK